MRTINSINRFFLFFSLIVLISSYQVKAQKADFVIINEDLTKVDPVRIRELKILETYVGGKKVFDSEQN